MGQLTLAKSIADNPAAHSLDQLRDAYSYLAPLRSNGGVRNSERASAKLERRLAAITTEIEKRVPQAHMYGVRHRHADPHSAYEVYDLASGDAIDWYRYKTERERAEAMGKANALRNDLNNAPKGG